jgi:hypothetical protein
MALAKDGYWMVMAPKYRYDREDANQVAQRPLMHDQQRRKRGHPYRSAW